MNPAFGISPGVDALSRLYGNRLGVEFYRFNRLAFGRAIAIMNAAGLIFPGIDLALGGHHDPARQPHQHSGPNQPSPANQQAIMPPFR